MGEKVFTNRLIHEKSPYLLQHAHNPVDWYPWGEEAFQKARDEDKPIFLSIGYSTCHWCHVMEEESFSDPEMAKVINEHFIPIKVDREERPDIDAIYMSAVQIMTGSGGWPLTAFLTHDLKPFFTGTYFPPEDRWGRPGLKRILSELSNAWNENREDVLKTARSVTEALFRYEDSLTHAHSDEGLTLNVIDKAYQAYVSRFDSKYGGFSQAPKFPMGHQVSFLLQTHDRRKDSQAREMAEKTLNAMSRGGIYDQVGGGFHRYSTDREWFLPHFEKMLYDQALLAQAYVDAYQLTKNPEYKTTLQGILDYVLENLTHREGGFYSAEDADSALDAKEPHVKKEGAFYVWEEYEILKILGKRDAELFNYCFGVKEKGNVSSDPHDEFPKKNILYRDHSNKNASEKFSMSEVEIESKLNAALKKLKTVRNQRVRPYLDDKVLTDWNGLMISSMANAGVVLAEKRYLDAAKRSADFILKNLSKSSGRLLHRFRDGESGIAGNVNDYAFFIHGLIDLYQGTFEWRYLEKTIEFMDTMIETFWDPDHGGFYLAPSGMKDLIIRQKDIADGAIPSGNSLAFYDLVRLSRITARQDYALKAEELMKSFAGNISDNPSSYAQFLIGLSFMLGPSKEIVIVGSPQEADFQKLYAQINDPFLPRKVVLHRPYDVTDTDVSVRIAPYIKGQNAMDGKATVFVCENYACKSPVTSPEALMPLLQ